MAKGGSGGGSKPVPKKVAKIVEDKTFGLKNKNSKKNQKIVQNMMSTIAGNQRKNTNVKPVSKKQTRAEHEQELRRLGLFNAAAPSQKPTAQSNATAAELHPADQFSSDTSNAAVDDRQLEDILEEMRHNLGDNLTPVTPETFKIWKEQKHQEKMEKKQSSSSKRERDIASGKVSMTGRELYDRNRSLFIDDERADDKIYDNMEEDWISTLEKQMRMDAEVSGEAFSVEKFNSVKQRITKELNSQRIKGHDLKVNSMNESEQQTDRSDPNKYDSAVEQIGDQSLFEDELATLEL